jgi:hypothetical protein
VAANDDGSLEAEYNSSEGQANVENKNASESIVSKYFAINVLFIVDAFFTSLHHLCSASMIFISVHSCPNIYLGFNIVSLPTIQKN